MEKMRLRRVKSFSAMFRRRFLQKSQNNFRFLIFIIVFCVSITLIYTSASMYFSSVTIGSKGTVKTLGVGVFWDKVCSNSVSYIDWEIVDPGSQRNVTVYVRNEGSVPTSISLDAVNWDPPSASSYIILSWDYLGQLVEPNESIEATLILSISSSVQNLTNFKFDIVIAGIG